MKVFKTMGNILKYLNNVYIKKIIVSKAFTSKYAKFGKGSILYTPMIYDENRELVSIGENTTILKNSRIQLFPHLVENNPHIIIGDNCYLGYNLTLLAGADIEIGNEVLFASNILVSSENHGMDPESEAPYMNQPLEAKPVRIEDGCWIGERVCVLPGVTIGKKSIVGAGSIVTKNIPPYSIAAGNPARVIKQYNFDTHKWEKVE